MQNIIGLGSGGCSIAKNFAKYPEYTIRTIDCVEPSGEEHFRIKKCDSHEEYERAVPDMSNFFSHIKAMDEVLFVIGGSRGSHARGRQMGPDAAFRIRAAQR